MAITAHTRYLGDLRTSMKHLQSGSEVLTDAPVDNHGQGAYFSPTDLLAASLGSCMLTIMGIAARAHGFDIDGAEVDVTKVMGTAPRRVVEIVVEITFPRDYDAKTKRILELSAKECPVGNSLHPDLKKTITLRYGK